MSPHFIDPKIDYHRLRELSDEFTAHWNRLQAFYLDAVAGFNFVLGHVEAEQETARGFVRGAELDSTEFQDTRMFSYAEIFEDGFCTSAIHHATHGEVKMRNQLGGANFTTLGQLCVIAFYDFWEDYLRPQYAIAKGVLDPNETGRMSSTHACASTRVTISGGTFTTCVRPSFTIRAKPRPPWPDANSSSGSSPAILSRCRPTTWAPSFLPFSRTAMSSSKNSFRRTSSTFEGASAIASGVMAPEFRPPALMKAIYRFSGWRAPIHPATLPHAPASCSAPRNDSALSVNVGFAALSVGKMPQPAT
jgi:hypothetical protein